ncbi:hypothetical protein [Rhizobium sp. NZLR11]|uniref:hypothetical protein n=1 Tax=Rhizobium sp. NZLR11 TaxID=2731098 RepID=UPI00287F5BEF|nr:hypothetical protein [Rhizobium sp. NZLR11]
MLLTYDIEPFEEFHTTELFWSGLTSYFLSVCGLEALRDLPDIEALEDAGLLSRQVIGEEVLAERYEQASREHCGVYSFLAERRVEGDSSQ